MGLVGRYVVILPILMVVQLALYVTYLVGRASFYSTLQVAWLGNLQSYFSDVYSTSSATLNSNSFAYLWNQLMAQQQCCGVSVRLQSTPLSSYSYFSINSGCRSGVYDHMD